MQYTKLPEQVVARVIKCLDGQRVPAPSGARKRKKTLPTS